MPPAGVDVTRPEVALLRAGMEPSFGATPFGSWRTVVPPPRRRYKGPRYTACPQRAFQTSGHLMRKPGAELAARSTAPRRACLVVQSRPHRRLSASSRGPLSGPARASALVPSSPSRHTLAHRGRRSSARWVPMGCPLSDCKSHQIHSGGGHDACGGIGFTCSRLMAGEIVTHQNLSWDRPAQILTVKRWVRCSTVDPCCFGRFRPNSGSLDHFFDFGQCWPMLAHFGASSAHVWSWAGAPISEPCSV